MKKQNHRRWLVVCLAILHLLADGMSAFVVFHRLYPQTGLEESVMIFFAYNGLAFLFQPFFGSLVDRVMPAWMATIAGIACIALGFVTGLPMAVLVVLVGIGNGLFHVGGGKLTYVAYPGKKAELGFFVAFGAVGLALGTLFASETMGGLFLAASLALLPLIALFGKPILSQTFRAEPRESSIKHPFIMGGLLLLAVFFRGAVGKAVPSQLPTAASVLIAVSLCIAMGKWMGGILADKTSNRLVILWSLPLSGLAFLGGAFGFPIMYLFGVFFFNMSMPITLDLMIRTMPGREGLAFGLLAAMLFPGYLVGMESIHGSWNEILSIVGVAACLWMVLYADGKIGRDGPCWLP